MIFNSTNQHYLYTIGYEGRDLYGFVNKLKDLSISTLIDVREYPLSRKKGFSKTLLSQYLKKNKIQYFHLKKLGSPKSLRIKVRLDSNYTYFFKEYSKYIKSQKGTIEELYQIIVNGICCIMCYEKEPNYCHRSIIAEELIKRDGNGLLIKHI